MRLMANNKTTRFFLDYYVQGFQLIHSTSTSIKLLAADTEQLQQQFGFQQTDDKSDFDLFWQLVNSIFFAKIDDHKKDIHDQINPSKKDIVVRISEIMSKTLQTTDDMKKRATQLVSLVSGYFIDKEVRQLSLTDQLSCVQNIISGLDIYKKNKYIR